MNKYILFTSTYLGPYRVISCYLRRLWNLFIKKKNDLTNNLIILTPKVNSGSELTVKCILPMIP